MGIRWIVLRTNGVVRTQPAKLQRGLKMPVNLPPRFNQPAQRALGIRGAGVGKMP